MIKNYFKLRARFMIISDILFSSVAFLKNTCLFHYHTPNLVNKDLAIEFIY